MDIIFKLKNGDMFVGLYTLKQGLLLRKSKLVIVPASPFKEKLLHYIHNNPQLDVWGTTRLCIEAKWISFGGE